MINLEFRKVVAHGDEAKGGRGFIGMDNFNFLN